MRALIYNGKLRYDGDCLRPVPSPDEALVQVLFAGVCRTDLEIARGYMSFSGIPGHEFSGVVVECRDSSLSGKRVVGEINIGCGSCPYCKGGSERHCENRKVLGILDKDGSFAEFLTIPSKNLHVLPDEISDEEATFVEPLAASFRILEQVEIDREKKVCVLGDGRLGLLTSMVLSLTGCDLVTMGKHREKLSILERRGIKTVTEEEKPADRFDIVVDCTGSISGFEKALTLVRPEGKIVLKTTLVERGEADLNRVVIDEIMVVGSRCGPFEPALEALRLKKVDVSPLITEVLSLEEGGQVLVGERKSFIKALLKIK